MNTGGAIENSNRPVGTTIALIVILLIIVIGAIYFWTSRTTYTPSPQNNQSTETNQSSSSTEKIIRAETILNQNTSDNQESIEADLQAFNQSDIDRVDSDF